MFIAGRVLIGFGEAFNVCAGEYSRLVSLLQPLELIPSSFALNLPSLRSYPRQ